MVQSPRFVNNLRISKLRLLAVFVVFLGLFFVGCKKHHKTNLDTMENTNKDNAANITIFVHGTHTEILTKLLKPVLFIPEELTTYNNLDQNSYVKWFIEKVSQADSKTFPVESFYAIGWSGALSSKVRFNAAQNLYTELERLVESLRAKNIEPQITVIGHSHGGNVALNLAKVHNLAVHGGQTPQASRVDFAPAKTVSRDKFQINKLVLLATPVQEETEKYIESDFFKKVYSLYSKADLIQVLDPQGLQTAKESFFSNRRFAVCDKLKQAKIKVNNRALLHEEFVFRKFPIMLPKVLEVMDSLPCDGKEHLIKIDYKNKHIKNIEVK